MRLRTIAILTCLMIGAGCGPTLGTRHSHEIPTPHKYFEAHLGPFDRSVKAQTNDGTDFTFTTTLDPETGKPIAFSGSTTSKSVELNEQYIAAIAAQTEMFEREQQALANRFSQAVDDIEGFVGSVLPTAETIFMQNPQKSKDPGWRQQVISTLLNEALAKIRGVSVAPASPPPVPGPISIPSSRSPGLNGPRDTVTFNSMRRSW